MDTNSSNTNRVRKLFCLATVAAVALLFSAVQVEAAIWSLADDFSLASNTNSTTWSYGLEGNVDAPVDMVLFATNTRDANNLWGTTFATPPTMWSDATGFWGIGRNDTGVTQTSGSVTWNPGEVMLHPQIGFPGRLVVSWLSPVTGTVDVDYALSSATNDGDGVGIQIKRNNDTLVGFSASTLPANPISNTLLAVPVTAGDRLYFQYDVWPSAGGDITLASIVIDDGVAVPEPSTFALAALGLVGLGWFGWRRRR